MTNPIIKYWPNGNKFYEKYLVNDKVHRDPLQGPAHILYNKNGNRRLEEYYVNGKLHNPYGPATINTVFNILHWHFYDKEYTNEVNEYLDKNNLIWQNMTQTEFDIMWTIIL